MMVQEMTGRCGWKARIGIVPVREAKRMSRLGAPAWTLMEVGRGAYLKFERWDCQRDDDGVYGAEI